MGLDEALGKRRGVLWDQLWEEAQREGLLFSYALVVLIRWCPCGLCCQG